MTVDNQEKETFLAIVERLSVTNPQRITDKLQAGEQVKGYWCTAPTGKPHIGYLVPLIKIAECIKAGVQVEIVIGDSYAYLVNYDTSLEVVQHRTRYYACLMTAVLKSLGVPTSEIRIVIESSTVSSTAEFQRNRMRMCAVTRIDEIRAVGAEVRDTAMISPLLCPMHQALWDIHSGCDFQLGGLDQEGIMDYAKKVLPRIGYEPPSYLLAALIPALKLEAGKMSSSAQADTKIMFSDSSDTVEEKIAGGDLPGGDDPANNGIMSMFEHIVFPFRRLSSSTNLEIRLESGLSRLYGDYDDLKQDVAKGLVNMESLGCVLSREINHIMEPTREEYATNTKWRLAEEQGYDMVDMTKMRV